LRPVHYDARSVGKFQVVVNPGDTLVVSDEVAAQLVAQSGQIKEGVAPPVEPPPDAEQSGEQPEAAAPEVTAVPRKTSARKARARKTTK
jgi:hypothetical protein